MSEAAEITGNAALELIASAIDDGLNVTEQEPETEESQPEATAEAEKPAEEQTEEEKPPEEDWTPEKLKEERTKLETEAAKLKEDQRRSDANWKLIRERETKIKRKTSDINAREQDLQLRRQELTDDIRGLQSGDTRTIISKMTKLTGIDGVELYRRLGEDLASDGRASRERDEKPKQDEETKKEIERLKAAEEARQEAANNERIIREVHSALFAEVSSERFPSLSRYAAEIEAEAKAKGQTVNGRVVASTEMLQRMEELRKIGRYPSVEDICNAAELKLQSRFAGSAVAPSAPVSGAATAETGPEPTHGASQASEGGTTLPGASISPSAASLSTGARRPATPEERDREAIRMIGDLIPADLL